MGLKTWLGLKKAPPPAAPPRRQPDFIKEFAGVPSRSQNCQDLWALMETGSMRGGFFVEIGAFDGINLSNTYLLEKQYGWTGILAEPNPRFTDDIRRIRSAPLCTSPVYSVSGERVSMLYLPKRPELSGMATYAFNDDHAIERKRGVPTLQTTISLNDLLAENNAPERIDFLSMDTEGSEVDILSTFDFERYDVRLFCIEHNATPAEKKLDEMILPRGYERVFREWSSGDAWYRRQIDLLAKRF